MMNQDDRQMYDVDLQCAECGAQITQLPFQPTGDKPVYCSNCLRNRRQASRNMNRRMYDVDINCAECGKHITQLPFQPTGDRPVYCFDCNKARRDA